jgi:hypothetical protein
MKKYNYFGSRMISRVSFDRESFGRGSFGRRVNWSCGHLDAWSLGRRLIWSQGYLVARSCGRGSFGGECLVASVRSQCIWSQGIWTRGQLVAWSFSCVVIGSHGFLVAGHLVAGHLVAGHVVAGHLVALNEKSIFNIFSNITQILVDSIRQLIR